MQNFTVYPKGKGKPFELQCEKYERQGDVFVLYDEANNIDSQHAFLSAKGVAAIIPEMVRPKSEPAEANRTFEYFPRIRFLVYLTDRSEVIEIGVHAFRIDDGSGAFRFLFQQIDQLSHAATKEWEVPGVYLDPSEVVAILPADGVRRR